MNRILTLTSVVVLIVCACSGNKMNDGFEKSRLQSALSRMSETQSHPKAGVDRPGLHNVIHVAEGLISGSQPHGDQGFDELVKLGVRTVISVDGARPDVERARARGMRYVHLPIGYDGIEQDRALQLARAVEALPGSVYIHCHHGRHRGPTAAAMARVLLGQMNRSEALDFMRDAGTSSHYDGLYAAVGNAKILDPRTLSKVPTDFPEIASLTGLVQTMAAIDRTSDNLKKIRNAGWVVPDEHPDLVLLTEASSLVDLLSQLRDDESISSKPVAFKQMLATAAAGAVAFKEAIEAANNVTYDARFVAVTRSCKDCHVDYRD